MVLATGVQSQVVMPKTQKMVFDASLLNPQDYKVRIKGRWCNPMKGVAPSSTPWRSSFQKESLQVALNYSQPIYLINQTQILLYGIKLYLMVRLQFWRFE